MDSVRLLHAERAGAAQSIADLRGVVSAQEFEHLVDRNAALNAGMSQDVFKKLLVQGRAMAEREALRSDDEGAALQRLYACWANEALAALANGEQATTDVD